MNITVIPAKKIVKARDLKEAYKKGFFGSSMSRWELIDRLSKYNETFKVHSTHSHRGLFDGDKFICGIGHNLSIPRFTIVRYVPELHRKVNYCDPWGNPTGSEITNQDKADGYVFARGWPEIFKLVANKGYEIDLSNL